MLSGKQHNENPSELPSLHHYYQTTNQTSRMKLNWGFQFVRGETVSESALLLLKTKIHLITAEFTPPVSPASSQHAKLG